MMPDLVAYCPVTLSFQIWDVPYILIPSPFPCLVRFFGSVVLQNTCCMSGAILLLERQLSAPEAYSSLRKVDRNHLGQVKILAGHTPRKGLKREIVQPCVCQECTWAAYHAMRREPDGEKAHAASLLLPSAVLPLSQFTGSSQLGCRQSFPSTQRLSGWSTTPLFPPSGLNQAH